jgi:hypothetical protein
MEPLPAQQLVVGRQYVFSGKRDVNPAWFGLFKSMHGTFVGYYHNTAGYCMQRFRDVTQWNTFEPTDLYNPTVEKRHFPSDYSCVRVQESIYDCSRVSRYDERTTRELIRRSILYNRRQVERGLTGTISLGGEFVSIPRVLIQLIASYGPPLD